MLIKKTTVNINEVSANVKEALRLRAARNREEFGSMNARSNYCWNKLNARLGALLDTMSADEKVQYNVLIGK